jgi:hypothetical protein
MLLEAVEAPLHQIALLVTLGIKDRGPAPAPPQRRTAGLLIPTLGNGDPDTPPPQCRPGGWMRVRLVRDQVVRAFARPPGAMAWYADVIEQGQQLGIVPDLAGGKPDGQRAAPPVDHQVDLGGQTSAGPAQRLAFAPICEPAGPLLRSRRAPAAC